MKTIIFQGKEYQVSDDARYITKDAEGIYTWEYLPELSEDGYYYKWRDDMSKIADDCLAPICEEIK